ncbi:MAG TPA: hypothetical protein VMT17_03915 [Anaeromyxobacteraceae bacterium]|nr:hypothetical protein [Anaeromyxobacteraceae bacterium]
MPVSKKRKKDGKPVQRSAPAATPEAAPAEGEAHHFAPQQRMGKPTNPFVAMQQARKGSQRGR